MPSFRLFAFSLAVAWAAPSVAVAARKPNILVIVADDQGYCDLGVQGCSKDVRTPAIDSLAKNGVRFTDGYVSGPYCSPTRAGLMTGRYQTRFGHEFNPGPAEAAVKNFGLPLTEKTMADRLKAAGYATGMVGKWHLGYQPAFHPQKRGFDEFFGFLGGAHSYVNATEDKANPIRRGAQPVDEKEYLTDAFRREALAFIDGHVKDPWFLYWTFNAVHAPLQATDRYTERFAGVTDQKRRTYLAMLSAMDDAIGAVLEKLKAAKLEEDTLIFYVSDNGGPPSNGSNNGVLHGHKAQTWEGGIRVPFIVQWKGRVPSGQAFFHPVIQLDILPTALAAAGTTISPAWKLDGVNLLPFLEGKDKRAPHEALYWRFGEQMAVRMGSWKLVKAPGDTGGMAKAKLFDLGKDIAEATNQADTHPEKAKELMAAWTRWDATLQAPLWSPTQRRRKQ